MSADGLRLAQDKMRAAGVNETAIAVFGHYYHQLESGATGLVREDTIDPLVTAPAIADVDIDPAVAREALDRTVIVKLNGGLGTSMGMAKAKSLLPVREGRSFLDIIAGQVRHARAAHGVRLPLILMNSFRTHDDSLEALAAYPDLQVEGLPLDFVQSQEPKLLVDGLTPVEWPADPSLEWCPPGHGDIYPSLLATGILEQLLDHGYRYACSSNADNLGAAPDAHLAGWFASSGAPYAAEVCRRTPADRKGGHLAVRRADGRLILRDTAQTAPEDMAHFTDEHRHPYFHTNNLWFDLERLHQTLTERGGVLGLPLIRNVKNVDPTDPESPLVYQVETALGAAVEVFEGASPVLVERGRFLPVKTTNDLLLVSSDAYDLGRDQVLRLLPDTAPLVRLDERYYKTVAAFAQRFPQGVPSLRRATSLEVTGDWTFGGGVIVEGDAVLEDPGVPRRVPDGSVL